MILFVNNVLVLETGFADLKTVSLPFSLGFSVYAHYFTASGYIR